MHSPGTNPCICMLLFCVGSAEIRPLIYASKHHGCWVLFCSQLNWHIFKGISLRDVVLLSPTMLLCIVIWASQVYKPRHGTAKWFIQCHTGTNNSESGTWMEVAGNAQLPDVKPSIFRWSNMNLEVQVYMPIFTNLHCGIEATFLMELQ